MCRLKYDKDLKDIIEVVKETVPKEEYISLERKYDDLQEHNEILHGIISQLLNKLFVNELYNEMKKEGRKGSK